MEDIRWHQWFNNYSKEFIQLELLVQKTVNPGMVEKYGLIKAFEYTYELAWNVLKDFFVFQGVRNIFGFRDAVMEAYKTGLIEDAEGWMEMFKDRNKTIQTFSEEVGDEVAEAILHKHFRLFRSLHEKMKNLKEKDS